MEKKNKLQKVVQLEVMEDLPDSGVSSIALVDEPAIEKYWVAMKKENFVSPSKGEHQVDFLPRCISAMIDEGKPQDQAVAMCYSMWEQAHQAVKLGFDPSALPPYVEQAPKKKGEKFIEPNPCWEGYEAYGTKILDGKEVPNCVPIKSKKIKPVATKMATVRNYKTQFAIEKDQQVLVGPAMIPDMEIYRKDDENPDGYFVKFSEATIAKIQEKFMREARIGNTNLNHNEEIHAKSYVFESWIVEDPKSDKANKIYNLNVPKGTWMVKMKVTDPEVWKAVKSGHYRGFSIEGNFIDKAELESIEKSKDMIESIMRILKS